MRNIFVLLVLAALLLPAGMAAPMPAGMSFAEEKKYTDGVNTIYKDIAGDYPQLGLLKVSSDLMLGSLSIMVTIDNATAQNVFTAVFVGSMVYDGFYSRFSWPDEAIIYVEKAGDTQIGVGYCYSPWVVDLGSPTDKNDPRNAVFMNKIANATKVWTWELPK